MFGIKILRSTNWQIVIGMMFLQFLKSDSQGDDCSTLQVNEFCVGTAHVCATFMNHSSVLKCWGKGTEGELG